MATTTEIESELREVSRRQTELAAEIERLKRELAEVREASEVSERLSPSVPLDAPDPSATLEVTAEEYDAFVKDLDAPPEPNERLRRTMSQHRFPRE
jgi:hypothetical protein